MEERPVLEKALDADLFRNYYYLKEELVEFCRSAGLPTTGSKIELTDRIAVYLASGIIEKPKQKAKKGGHKASGSTDVITESSVIEADFVCSERHRAFFKEKLGASFSFNVAFQKWLKTNTGKTYRDALEAYHEILKAKKSGKTVIDRQFEYNTYIRDFFAANKDRALNEAIQCWNYKKNLPGHNRYEETDLAALAVQ